MFTSYSYNSCSVLCVSMSHKTPSDYNTKIVNMLKGEISKVINQISEDYHINKHEMLQKYLPTPASEASSDRALVLSRLKHPAASTTTNTLPHESTEDELLASSLVESTNSIQKEPSLVLESALTSVERKRKKRKRRILNPGDICMARKQDGKQCTRRRKSHFEYCGKHMHSRKFGRIDDPTFCSSRKSSKHITNRILTWVELFGDTEYLVDEHDIVYTNNVQAPTIIGKRYNGDQILRLQDMVLD